MKIVLGICVLALSAPLCAAPKKPVAAKHPLAPLGSYTTYALAKDAKSFDRDNPLYAEAGGFPASVRRVGPGYAELSCGSSQQILRAPLGWMSDEDGQNSKLFTPDQKTRIIMGFRDQGEGGTFAKLKTTLLADTRAQMTQMGQKAAKVRAFALPGGSYAVEVTNVSTESGNKNGFLQVFTPNPQNARYPLGMSLTAPMSAFPKYRGLIGLILRDRKIVWAG